MRYSLVSILLAQDDPAFQELFRTFVEQNQGFCLHESSSVREAREMLAREQYDIIITGYESEEDIFSLLTEIRESGNITQVIILTGRGREEVMIEALNKGAYYVLPKTGNTRSLCTALITIIHRFTEERKRQSSAESHAWSRTSGGEKRDSDRKPPESNYAEALMDAIPVPVFYRDIQGVYQDCNQEFEQLVGLKKEGIIGKTIHDLFPHELADHYQYMDDLIIKEPYVQQYEYRITNSSGENFDVLFSKSAIFGEDRSVRGIIGIIFDISDRKKFEQIVYSSEEKYRTLADYTYDWEAWISPEGIYLYVSPSCERITGFTADQFIEDPELVVQITHRDDREMIRDHYRKIPDDKTGVHHLDYRILTKSGEERWISHICQSVYRDDGTWLGRRESKRDITFRKQIEKAYQQANVKLNLLSSITRHDVLNQLSVLIGFTDMALEMNTDQEIKVMLSRVMAAAETISSQISFTRTYEDIGIQAPVWQHIPVIISKASAGIRIVSIKVDPSLTCVEVLADPLLEKVFFCLLDNSERHGKTVKTARFSCRKEGAGIIIVYEDDGIGIDQREKRKIFERGFGKNTGYGLFLAKEILAISGNSITETGVSGEGARFEIGFPPGSFRRLNPT